jgi:hypothetical protein
MEWLKSNQRVRKKKPRRSGTKKIQHYRINPSKYLRWKGNHLLWHWYKNKVPLEEIPNSGRYTAFNLILNS